MSGYNLCKPTDRDRLRRAYLAELRAIREGRWPRTVMDELMHSPGRADPAAHAKRMCEEGLSRLDRLERRIARGDLEAIGYKPRARKRHR